MAGLDYEFAPIDVSIMTHPKACSAGPEAMGLWLFGQAYAKAHKTGGHLHRSAVLAAWGGKRNIMLAKRLVDAGLWIAREDGDWDVHNFDRKAPGSRARGSEPPRSSTERARVFRERKKALGAPDATDATATETDMQRFKNGNGSTSISDSLSDLSPRRDPEPDRSPTPEWWAGAISTAEMALGGTIDQHLARWLEYDSSRERKGWQRNHRDAVGWLTTVIRTERKNVNTRAGPKGAEITKQPFDPEAPWMKIGDTGT